MDKIIENKQSGSTLEPGLDTFFMERQALDYSASVLFAFIYL